MPISIVPRILMLMVAIAFSTITFSAHAQSARTQYDLALGFGAQSCADYLAAQSDVVSGLQRRLQFGQWIFGFISALNIYAPNNAISPAKVFDSGGVLAYVTELCKSEPSLKVSMAAASFVQVAGGLKAPGS